MRCQPNRVRSMDSKPPVRRSSARAVNPSRRVVAALADALHLSDADRAYVFALTGHQPSVDGDRGGPAAAHLQQLVHHVDVPGYCTDALTRVLAWNAAAVEVFGDYGRWPDERRILLRLAAHPHPGQPARRRHARHPLQRLPAGDSGTGAAGDAAWTPRHARGRS